MQIQGKVLLCTRRVEEQPSKRPKKNGNKSAVDYIEDYTMTIRMCISRHGVAEIFIDFTEELNHDEINPMSSTHQSRIESSQQVHDACS